MTEEQKDLLLKDLCSRLMYGVKCAYYDRCVYEQYDGTITGMQNDTYFVIDGGCIDVENVKPYLFPLSSMTEDLKNELYTNLTELELKAINDEIDHSVVTAFEIEFYHKYHIDYRGLIHMGLAIDATNINIY